MRPQAQAAVAEIRRGIDVAGPVPPLVYYVVDEDRGPAP
jgi:hypothetical protein